jgi:hypothetical protein
VSPKRGDRVAPPSRPGEWEVRFLENDAAKGWDELCRQAPGNAFEAWKTMRENPSPPMDARRHHRLRDELATGTAKGKVLEHWQIEVTGGGRVWYLVDPDTRTVWIDHAGTGHPRATE